MSKRAGVVCYDGSDKAYGDHSARLTLTPPAEASPGRNDDDSRLAIILGRLPTQFYAIGYRDDDAYGSLPLREAC